MKLFFKKNYITSLLFIFFTLSCSHEIFAEQNSKLLTIPLNTVNAKMDSADKKILKITKLALRKLKINLPPSGKYNKAKIQPIETNTNKYILIYLLDKYDLSFKTVKVVLDQNDNIQSVVNNYKLKQQDLNEQPKLSFNQQMCPDNAVRFVAASDLYNDYGNIKKAIDSEILEANKDGIKAYKLVGKDATVENYENWLSCPNLKGFSHIGHGNTSGIILLNDGVLDANTIKKDIHLNLHTLVTFDSCDVFNDPLKNVMINDAKAQKFSGGISSLMIYGSTEAYACTWKKVLEGLSFSDSLKSCEVDNDPSVKDSRSGLYVANTSVYSKARLFVQTTNPKQLIDITGVGSDAVIHLSSNESISRIYYDNLPEFMGNSSCAGFSKDKGLDKMLYTVSADPDQYSFYTISRSLNTNEEHTICKTLDAVVIKDGNSYKLGYCDKSHHYHTAPSGSLPYIALDIEMYNVPFSDNLKAYTGKGSEHIKNMDITPYIWFVGGGVTHSACILTKNNYQTHADIYGAGGNGSDFFGSENL